MKKIREQVETYRKFGTGLGDPAFKKLVRLDENPTPSESKPKVDDRQTINDSDDEDFDPEAEGEEDVTSLGSGFEIETAFELLSVASPPPKKMKTRMSSSSNRVVQGGRSNTSFENNVVGEKFLAVCPDGRLAGMVKLPSGFNGTIRISDDCRKVVMKTMIPKAMQDATKALRELGVPKTDVFVVLFQHAMDLVKEDSEEENGKRFTESVIFHLPCKV